MAPHAQGKLVRVTARRVFDGAVDMRRGSAGFGKWVGIEVSAANHRQLWIPTGFAHGPPALSESADFLYKTTDYHAPEHKASVKWKDATLAIGWPTVDRPPRVPQKRAAPDLTALAFR